MPSVSKVDQASHIEARRFTGRLASKREVGPLTGKLGLSKKGKAYHREAGPLKGRQGLSQGGQPSHRKAVSLIGRPGLSQKARLSQGG